VGVSPSNLLTHRKEHEKKGSRGRAKGNAPNPHPPAEEKGIIPSV